MNFGVQGFVCGIGAGGLGSVFFFWRGWDLGVVAASEDHLRRAVPVKSTTFEDCIDFGGSNPLLRIVSTFESAVPRRARMQGS